MTLNRKKPELAVRAFCAAVIACLSLSVGCDKQPAATNNPGPPGQPPAKPALPSYWMGSDFDAWVGQRWDAIDLFQFLPAAPKGIDTGKRYVVFYSRTCSHCEEMFREDLAPNPDLAALVTAVEIPDDQDKLRSPDAWDMPENACEHMNLPLGANWIITAPIAVRIEDGVIMCATEGGGPDDRYHKTCLEL